MNKRKQPFVIKAIKVHSNELCTFLCISVLMFLVAYIHSVLHISKDTLIISHLGTECISAIKLWIMLPMAVLSMFAYIKLSDKFTRAQLFHISCWFFIMYFVLFALVLYPTKNTIAIQISDQAIIKWQSLKYLIKIISNWHYTLFYVFSEEWTIIMMSISFWQIANHLTTVDQSKRFYPLFGLAAGVGKMVASVLSASYVTKNSSWQPTLNNVVLSVVICGIAISICLIFLERFIGKENFNLQKNYIKTKKKAGLIDSLKYIASSKIILFITSLLFCYNISLNLVEGVWKKSIEVLFNSDVNQIHSFISNVDIGISTLSILGAFLGVYILRVLKWRTAALFTPVIVCFTGVAFFLFMLARNMQLLISLQMYVILIAVYFGAIHNIFTRSSKYALFDPTKESLYIPLDDNLKTKGKAASETIGLRCGKGSGAFIQQLLLILFPSLSLLELSSVIFVIFLGISLWWIYATVGLDKLLHKTSTEIIDTSVDAEKAMAETNII